MKPKAACSGGGLWESAASHIHPGGLGGPAGPPVPIGLHFIPLGSFALKLSFNLRSRMAGGAKSFKAMPPLFDWCLVCLVWGAVGKERIAKLRMILSLLLRTEAE